MSARGSIAALATIALVAILPSGLVGARPSGPTVVAQVRPAPVAPVPVAPVPVAPVPVGPVPVGPVPVGPVPVGPRPGGPILDPPRPPGTIVDPPRPPGGGAGPDINKGLGTNPGDGLGRPPDDNVPTPSGGGTPSSNSQSSASSTVAAPTTAPDASETPAPAQTPHVDVAPDLVPLPPCFGGDTPRPETRAPLSSEVIEALAMTGVGILRGARLAGRLTWWAEAANQMNDAADILNEAATTGVEETTDEIEAELLVINRNTSEARYLVTEAKKYPKNSAQYRYFRKQYYTWVRRNITNAVATLPPADASDGGLRGSLRFIAHATTHDPTIFMHVVQRGARSFLLKKLGESFADRWLGKTQVRGALNTDVLQRTMSQAEWHSTDRFARLAGNAVRNIAADYAERASKSGWRIAAAQLPVVVSQERHGGCLEAQVAVLARQASAPIAPAQARIFIAPALALPLARAAPVMAVMDPIPALPAAAAAAATTSSAPASVNPVTTWTEERSQRDDSSSSRGSALPGSCMQWGSCREASAARFSSFHWN